MVNKDKTLMLDNLSSATGMNIGQEKFQKPNPGETLGNCNIVKEIGDGSMGVVYHAFDSVLEIERAIKLLKPGKSDYVRQKFEAEGKIAAHLDHPNIVKVYGSGYWNGLPYIQMEMIKGKSLRVFIQAYPHFHPVISLSVISIIAGALDYTYRQSISIWGNASKKLVHRDLKPENILISKETGILKITDFGLALLDRETGATGWGTPQYMSPEQHDDQDLDCRSDIYSLGVILYEMLSGKRPFPDEIEEMVPLKKQGKYQPVTKHNPSISKSISDIIDQCLEPNREKRFREHESLKYSVDTTLIEMTPRSPKEIFESFAKDPENYVPALIRNKKKPNRLIIPIISCLLLVPVLFFVNFQMHNVKEIKMKPVPHPVTELTSANGSISDTSVPNPSLARKDSTSPAITLKTSDNNKNTTQVAPTQPQIKAGSDAKMQKSMLSEVFQAYRSEDFTKVISLISALDFTKLENRTRDSASILMINSYYMTSMINKALEFAMSHKVEDAHYYYILALSFDVLNDFTNASTNFDKAIISPNKTITIPRKNILYDRASFYVRYFQNSHSSTIKQAAIEACETFLRECCKAGSDECTEITKSKSLL